MKNFALIISLILFINTNAQIDNVAEKLGFEKDARLLIIHGDDIGVSHSVNIASFDGFKNNAINSGSAMIPSPWIKEVAEFHKENPKYDIGLYVAPRANLTKGRIRFDDSKNFTIPWSHADSVFNAFKDKGGFVMSLHDTIYSAANGAKTYKILPIGATIPFIVEERYIKVKR